MKRIVIWLASTVSIVVLLFGYHTSTNSATPPSASSGSATTASSSATGAAAPPDPSSEPTAGSSSSPSPSSSSSSSTRSTASKTYTGDVAQTRWGPVRVKITVKNGTITAVDVVEHPTGNHQDLEINDYALPILVQDTLDAQSAKIDMVSGATVTSDGYVESLQSALDQAGL